MVAVIHLRETPALLDPVQFTIAAEENSTLAAPLSFAVSHDGRQMAFVAALKGVNMLWVRPLAEMTARALAGTECAVFPFWKPDGRTVGFFAAGKLKTVDVEGGQPAVLCDAIGLGGTWNRSNVIVFTPSATSPLHKIGAAGGISTPVTTLDKGETSHRLAWFLPDGQHVLYLAVQGTARELRIASLGSTETTLVGAAESNAVYAVGNLLFSRAGRLMAQSFDPATGKKSGEPSLLAEQVAVQAIGRVVVSVSDSGVLAHYRGAPVPAARLTWKDRDGKTLAVVGDVGRISTSVSARTSGVWPCPWDRRSTRTFGLSIWRGPTTRGN
jgi:hypothetical protein